MKMIASTMLCTFLLLAVASTGVLLKERPVMKVVRMLQDMAVELEKERAEDQEVHEMIECWCESNEKEKGKAISDAEAKITDLDSAHGEYTGKISELMEGISSTREKLITDKKALDTATAVRMKENQAFHESETDLLGAIDQMKQALIVLSKHNPSLAQLRKVGSCLKGLAARQLAKDKLGRDKMAILSAFLEQTEEMSSTKALRRIPGFQSYAPQSGQIFGILKQMKEEFQADLSDEQQTEQKAQADFEALRDAKQAELAAGQKQLDQLSQDMAEFREKQVAAWQEMEDTKAQLKIDQEFMRNLLKRCSASEAEYEERVKSRLEEIQAVQDTIAFLNSPTAFDAFEKNANAGAGSAAALVQTRAARASRQAALARVAEALRRAGVPQLALLADTARQTAQLDAFTKVKAAIDKMVEELTRQQAEEVKHRDWCVEEMDTNTRETAKQTDMKTSLETKIGDLSQTIEKLTAEIKTKQDEIAEFEKEMKKASETREAENQDYQQTIADQQVTQAILQKALDRMRQVYAFDQQPGAPHMQLSGNHTDAGSMPARFSKYEKKAGGSRVVSMLEEILTDCKKVEDEAHVAELNAAGAYDNYMQESNRAIIQHQRSISDMSENKAKSEMSLGMAKSDLESTNQELEGLAAGLGDLKQSCDFLLHNFDARQEARATEIKALGEAKAILSGME